MVVRLETKIIIKIFGDNLQTSKTICLQEAMANNQLPVAAPVLIMVSCF